MSHPRLPAVSPDFAGRGGRESAASQFRGRELAAATVGSVVESFDWNMYAVLAPFFAAQLFPGGSSGAPLVAYAGFAVGFVARPLGGMVIGRLADRHGRRFGLTLSMSVIAAASLLIAVVPERADIGSWAAGLVVAARLVQGLAYGGETPVVAAYVTETAPAHHRFLYSSISYAGIIVGSLLSFSVIGLMTAFAGAEAPASGAWRWGFVLAALTGVAAVWVRRSAPESGAHEAQTAAHGTLRPPIRTVFTQHPQACAALFMMTVGGTVSFYFAMVYLPVYADHTGAANKVEASAFMTVVFLVTLVAMVVAGAATDRVGLLPMLRGAYAAVLVATPLLVVGLETRTLSFHLVAVALGLLVAVPIATANVLTGLLFPTPVRAVGAGIIGAAAIAMFGGTFPFVAEALTSSGHGSAVPYYVASAAAIGLVGTFVVARVPGFSADPRATTRRSSREKSLGSDLTVLPRSDG